jgi:hypothetical protein
MQPSQNGNIADLCPVPFTLSTAADFAIAEDLIINFAGVSIGEIRLVVWHLHCLS